MILIWILLIIIAILAIYVISVYNGFVSLKTKITAALQEIGNQLKRQAELIPNLEETVKGYVKHESGIYQSITDARKTVAQVDLNNGQSLDNLETSLTNLNSGLKVQLESNPELKANTNFQSLMSELTQTADKIMYARRAVINLTQNYNEKLVTFPSNLVAKLFGFQAQAGIATPETGAHVEVSEAETKPHQVKF